MNCEGFAVVGLIFLVSVSLLAIWGLGWWVYRVNSAANWMWKTQRRIEKDYPWEGEWVRYDPLTRSDYNRTYTDLQYKVADLGRRIMEIEANAKRESKS